jgi:hypothetical protein
LIGVCDHMPPVDSTSAASHGHDGNPGRVSASAATLTNAQRPNRTVLYTAPELSELHNLGLARSQLTHVLLQARRGMIAGDGFLRSERRQIGVRQVQLFNLVAHALQSLGLRLGRT